MNRTPAVRRGEQRALEDSELPLPPPATNEDEEGGAPPPPLFSFLFLEAAACSFGGVAHALLAEAVAARGLSFIVRRLLVFLFLEEAAAAGSPFFGGVAHALLEAVVATGLWLLTRRRDGVVAWALSFILRRGASARGEDWWSRPDDS